MKKIINSLVLLILSNFLNLSYCARKKKQDSNNLNSRTSKKSSPSSRVNVNPLKKALARRKNASISKKNYGKKVVKLALFKLEIIYKIIGSCKKIHEYFTNKNIQVSEYDNLYEDLLKIDTVKEVKYNILNQIYNRLHDGYSFELKQPLTTFNLMYSFSDFTNNFVIRANKESELRSILKSENASLKYQFFVFSYKMKKSSPWQCYHDMQMNDNLGVQCLTIIDGVISVRTLKIHDEIGDKFLFEDNFFDFTILNIPTYLFLFSDEKMSYIIDTYVKDNEFIFPEFISHSYKILGFLVHNVDKNTFNYYEVLNNMVHFRNDGTELTTEEIMDHNGFIRNDDGYVVFMLEKIED